MRNQEKEPGETLKGLGVPTKPSRLLAILHVLGAAIGREGPWSHLAARDIQGCLGPPSQYLGTHKTSYELLRRSTHQRNSYCLRAAEKP